jgi:hypothetical protein
MKIEVTKLFGVEESVYNEDLTVFRLKVLQYVKNIDNVKSAVTRKGKIHCVMKNGKKMSVDTL